MLRPHIIPLEESVQTIRLRLFTRGKIKIIHKVIKEKPATV